MKWFGEIIVICGIIGISLIAIDTYRGVSEYCENGQPRVKDDLTRGELVVYNVFIRPGMSLGCYLAEEAK